MAKKSEKSKKTMDETITRFPQYPKMKSALSPLIKNLEDESSAAYLFVKRNCETVGASLDHAIEATHLLVDMIESISPETTSPRIISLLALHCYLATVESAATTLIDTVLLLLIVEGHDLHIERRFVRHVSCFEDLAKVELWTKLEFLEEHDLKPLSRIFDRKLRNKIAHLDFTIETDGTIKTGKGARIDIKKKRDLLFDNIRILGHVFVELGFDEILGRMIRARKEESKK